jgi:hypothetical protein
LPRLGERRTHSRVDTKRLQRDLFELFRIEELSQGEDELSRVDLAGADQEMRRSSASRRRRTANWAARRHHWASETAMAYGLSAGDQLAVVSVTRASSPIGTVGCHWFAAV